ncbi:E3 ubiquitin-protein ligase RNF183 [Melanotaenia boesemani]|uniref:E3 ubiquitin-protein ligase RNF183 n=1 Tax=Melanotaenia boesemani TaxID=1250792 RepID=UPI001C03AC2F|nr:E3 ubiquitin-protein ligase RNF183 [Melanotaenia boesemani]
MSDEMNRSRAEGTRPAPNVKPKPNQNETNSKDEHRKKEKPAKVRRSRSTDSERPERGRRRERDRRQGERSHRGRSEETRRRDRKEGESDWKKKPAVDDVEDTECAVCFCSYDNVFKTPKLLACGHTFCLECLARINVTSPEMKTLSCPVCRELTGLPHGRDLPRLDNNLDIISKLPADMQRALSVRFKRSKGKLVLKNPPPNSPTKPNILSLPKKSQDAHAPGEVGVSLGMMEQGLASATVVDVGQPPNRVGGRLRRLFRSDRCYYAVVASIITITVLLMLVGILAFVIVPNVTLHNGPFSPPNHAEHDESSSETHP